MPIPEATQGQQRVVIERVTPELDGGKWAIKAVPGDEIYVEANIFQDGHDKLSARLLYRHEKDKKWTEVTMRFLNNDRYGGFFPVEKQGYYYYTIEGWADHAASWQHEIGLKIRDGQHVNVELLVGANLLDEMAKQAKGDEKKALQEAAKLLRDPNRYHDAVQMAMSFMMNEWIHKFALKHHASRYTQELRVYVDREKAVFSTWYSLFPRSTHPEPGKHGTFKTTEGILPRLADLGFDVLYIPPIHPIGYQFRKGKNNSTTCTPDDPGVPYGIGSDLGGHDAILPELGTLDDLKSLMKAAKGYGIELALDLAIQCSPDHPWVKSNPEWFKIRPDGTIQYAENPPKKYQDIYPVNFETENWRGLWEELRRIIFVWAEWGVRIIRVDNPHTKAFGFWEWVIAETKAKYPDMIFLSEAFTRPRVMEQLAKLGFTQSYTYYVWRTSKYELMEYMTELTKGEMRHYFRPNFWPNTHDINPYMLQGGLEPLFLVRYFLAATLASNYGIFGPTYEYMVHEAYPGKEEYLNSEKYEIKHWDWTVENKLTSLIRIVNRCRKENAALQRTNNITFVNIPNDNLIGYLKTASDGNRILCVVNLDGNAKHGSGLQLSPSLIGKSEHEEYIVHDLLTDAKYVWKGEWNYVELNPHVLPMHLFRIEDRWE
ncbi:MAG: alpha-1,4-glucan--maltose-1-phosphate maltosyltransferase [Spirosomataceae bacterium]